MKTILLVIILILKLTFVEGQVINIEIQGKTYYIKGNNLTIIVGRNPIVNISKDVPIHVKDSIRAKYQNKIDNLNQKFKKNQISFSEQEALLKRYKIEYETANAAAEKLAIEFSSVDFRKQTYLYRLAYVIYNEGDVEAALNVLSDFNLERNEVCQSVQYILLGATLWMNNKKDEAISRLETASKKYPSFISYGNLADYLQKSGHYENAILNYQQATQLAENLQEKYYALTNCSYCLSILYRKSESRIYADKALLAEKSIHNPFEKDTACYIAPPLYSLPISYTEAKLNYILGSLEYQNRPEIASSFFQKALKLIYKSSENSINELYRLILKTECYIGLREKILANNTLEELFKIVQNSYSNDYSNTIYQNLKQSIENL